MIRRRGDTPFEVIAEALEEPAGRASFVRGLTLGALVGAAVVGSLLRARQVRSRGRLRPAVEPEVPAAETDAGAPAAIGLDTAD